MRRIGRYCGSLAVLLAAVWCVVWVVGRGHVSAHLDAEIARMQAAGIGLNVGGHVIAGFPFAYAAEFRDVTWEDPQTGARTALPAMRSVVDLTAPGRLVTELPARFTVTLPAAAALRARYPDLPAEIAIALETEGLSLATEAVAGPDGSRGLRVTLSAAAIRVAPAEPDAAPGFALRLEGVAGTATLGGAPGPDGSRGQAELAMDRLVLALSEGPAPGAVALDLALAGARLAGSTTAGDPAALDRLLRGIGADRGTLRLEARRLDGAAETAGGARADGRIGLGAESFSVALAIGEGQIALGAATGAAALALAPADPANPVRGTLAAGRLAVSTTLPHAPGAAMRRVALDAEASGLSPEPAIWARIDPEGRLPRDPAGLRLRLDGEARLHPAPLPGTAPGTAPAMAPGTAPVEFGRLDLAELSVAALGARGEGSGAVAFDPATQAPRGTLGLRLSGALTLVRRLNAAGLLSQEQVQALATAAALYTRAGGGPDELAVDLAFDDRGLRVNGDPLH